MLKYVFLRLFLWVIGVFVSLFPTLYALGTDAFQGNVVVLATLINNHGQFRDVLFVLVTVAVLELSLLCDFVYVRFREADDNLFLIAIVLLLTNCAVLAASLAGFAHLPIEGRIATTWVSPVLRLVIGGAAVGLLTEIAIACANYYLDGRLCRIEEF